MEVTTHKHLNRALNNAAQEAHSHPAGRLFGRISKTKGNELILYRDQISPDEIESTIRNAKKRGYNKVTIKQQEHETGHGPCGKLCHCQTECQFL